jgi:NitT/TauT family transport system substrate-binding protein
LANLAQKSFEGRMKSMNRRRALGAVASATAAFALPARRADPQPATSIRVAMIPIEAASGVYYAIDNGMFAKARLDVDVAQNPSTPATAAALIAGTYDIAYATIPTVAIAHAHGVPFVCVAPGIGWAPGKFAGVIMVGAQSTIKTAKDFNGKTFGTAGLGTIAEYQPRAWIDKHGGDSTTVHFVEMPFPVIGDAMGSGRVDAAYMVEPFITSALKHGTARVLVGGNDAIGASYTSSGWYTSLAYANTHPDVIAKFAAAMSEAAHWANTNPAKVVPILVKELHADPAITAEAKRSYFPESLSASDVQPWIDVTARYAKFASFPASEILYAPRR